MSEPSDPLSRALALLRSGGAGAKVAAILRAAVLFRGCRRGAGVRAYGRVRVENEGTVDLGDRVLFVGGMIPTELLCRPGGQLTIGAQTVLNYGASIEAHAAVRIGRRCMLASFVRLCDTGGQRTAPITVGDDVWLAHGAIVEPGVTIGEGSVVAAGSVVVSDVPPRSIASGNPARCMPLALTGHARAADGPR